MNPSLPVYELCYVIIKHNSSLRDKYCTRRMKTPAPFDSGLFRYSIETIFNLNP